jgi:hypothetical protein
MLLLGPLLLHVAAKAASLCRRRSARIPGKKQKSFERDVAGTLPCRRVRSNAVGPVTQRVPPSSGCTAEPRMDVTFGRQNCAGNSRDCDTGVHAVHIVGIFGAGTIATCARSAALDRVGSGLRVPGWGVMRRRLSFLSLARGDEQCFYNGCHGARFNPPTGM